MPVSVRCSSALCLFIYIFLINNGGFNRFSDQGQTIWIGNWELHKNVLSSLKYQALYIVLTHFSTAMMMLDSISRGPDVKTS